MKEKDKLKSQEREIISYLKSVNRKGINNLIRFLYDAGYFYVYGSFKHHKWRGGLAEHSLEVLKIAIKHNTKDVSRDSIIIAALLHDICKVMYEFPPDKEYWGHGRRSVLILEDWLKFELTPEERRAIRFHLGYKSKTPDEESLREFEIAKNEDLWHLIHVSDSVSAGGYPHKMYKAVETVIDKLNL